MRPRVLGQGRRPGARGGRWRGLLLAAAPWAMPLPAFAADNPITNQAFQNGHIIVLSALACGGVVLAIATGMTVPAQQRLVLLLRPTQRQARPLAATSPVVREAL